MLVAVLDRAVQPVFTGGKAARYLEAKWVGDDPEGQGDANGSKILERYSIKMLPIQGFDGADSGEIAGACSEIGVYPIGVTWVCGREVNNDGSRGAVETLNRGVEERRTACVCCIH